MTKAIVECVSEWVLRGSRLEDTEFGQYDQVDAGFGLAYAVTRVLDESGEPGTGSCAGKLLLRGDGAFHAALKTPDSWAELAAFITTKLEADLDVRVTEAEQLFNGPAVVVQDVEPNDRPWARLAAWDFITDLDES